MLSEVGCEGTRKRKDELVGKFIYNIKNIKNKKGEEDPAAGEFTTLYFTALRKSTLHH